MDQLFYSFGSQFFSNRSSVPASELLMRSCRKIPIEIGPISRTVYINYITVPEALKNFPHFQILFAFRGTGTRYLYNTLLKGSSTTREKAFLLRLHLGVANVWSWPTFAASPQRLDWKHLGGGLTSWILVEKLGVRFCSNGLYTSREKLACWLQSLHLMDPFHGKSVIPNGMEGSFPSQDGKPWKWTVLGAMTSGARDICQILSHRHLPTVQTYNNRKYVHIYIVLYPYVSMYEIESGVDLGCGNVNRPFKGWTPYN